MSDHPTPRALVVYANYAEFRPRASFGSSCVDSRMLLWCRRGGGRVRADGRDCRFGPERFLILPWGHAIEYTADANDPFFLAGIHIVPDLELHGKLIWRVRHAPSPPIADDSVRQDVPLPGLEALVEGSFQDFPALAELAEYTVRWYLREPRELATARDLARLLISEWRHVRQRQTEAVSEVPPALRQVLHFIAGNLAAPLSITDLARVGDCSPATIFRWFRDHCGTTPKLYLRDQRLQRAARLLRTTLLRVNEVALRVGIDDDCYFAKIFRQAYGVSAGTYRRRFSVL